MALGWALKAAQPGRWIVPPRGPGRQGDAAANVNSYGTTLRTYDPKIDAWHIQWTDPVTQTYSPSSVEGGRHHRATG